ncbi:MAG: Flp pilus assembly protein CpaB [Candidatus Omnitrophica bacterium]|jgi:pilus assembly protein CpaB|nr:Flp pilus assembly protein CpaB [Candidatus Omnitrophota bacterium]
MDQVNPEFRKKILIVVAIACGILAALLGRAYIADKEAAVAKQMALLKQREAKELAAKQHNKVSVLVAARNITPGVPILPEDLTSREVPEEFLQPGAIRSSINIVGMLVQTPIIPGEQILRTKLGAPPEKPKILSEITPKGKRAVPVVVDNITSLAGLLQPGDYVDALAIITPPQGSYLYALAVDNTSGGQQASKNESKLVTLPLFQNILVLAVGSEMGPAASGPRGDKSKEKAKGSDNTVTMSLSPQEAALVSFIQEQGKIRLVMRSNSDVAQTKVDPVNWDNLFDYLYPKAKDLGGKPPATVEIYRGLQKEVIPLSEGKKK